MIKKKLIDINKLKPLEKVFNLHLKNVGFLIERDKKVIKPIIIDKKNKIVLDGSHRYAFLFQKGYKLAPVVEVDYSDESIFVGNHLHHRFLYDSNKTLTKEKIIKKALSKKYFLPRTTRHFFPFRKIDMITNLNKLELKQERCIKNLVHKISTKDEIKFNLKFIEEINNELNIIDKYILEQIETKKYLRTQNKLFNKYDKK